MKRMIRLWTLLLALSLALCGAARAEERETLTDGDFAFALLADGTAEITKYSGSAEELVIPAELGGRKVTAIGDSAFYNCFDLKSVTIPDSVTAIGDSAFSYCWNLTSVTIPDSVTAIGDSAFIWCSSLTGVTIPDSVAAIGANPFAYCSELTEVIVSKDHPALATIDGVLFSKADRRLVWYPMTKTGASYAIPQGIRIIGDSAFSYCESLTGVTIPDSVTAIGYDAFYGCDSLTLTVPAGSYAEQYCIDNGLRYETAE